MKEKGKISSAVIRRLPRYRRYLEDLLKKDVERISSGELSRHIGYTASQIRQDFNNFGGFGQQGYGYNVKSLYEAIGGIMGLNREYKMTIIGCGNVGQAIANYSYYYEQGFRVVSLFDVDETLIGSTINEIEVRDAETLGEYLAANAVDIGIICTSKSSAQEAADKLCAGGVKGIWNFAPMDLTVPENVALENVHLSDSLHSLAYYINENEKES
ncbi:MAG: redox-sensing transcriptional repressor Rex [Anaerovoracaceae bacterium]|nr:redox-sensing transcriptional repressor Rex [Bacillota bacterium]MDY3953909.1 redox-sensing transcriptional repressor Rex [Anaerovoracaceae bacterium]